jgi:hypothetical protein
MMPGSHGVLKGEGKTMNKATSFFISGVLVGALLAAAGFALSQRS